MLTPEYLQKTVEETEQIAAEFSEYCAVIVATRIKKLFEATQKAKIIPASIYKIRQMREARKTMEEVVKAVEKYTPKLENVVRHAFQQATVEIEHDAATITTDILEANPEIKKRVKVDNIKLPSLKRKDASAAADAMTPKEKRLMERAYKATNSEIRNYTRTTASDWQKEFITECDKAYWKTTHGTSINDAIREAVDNVAQYGTHIVYPSGHRDRVEVAVARAVRTGIAQAAGDITLTRCAEMGVNHVIVTSHIGARTTPRIEPANHYSWQGQVYSLNWGDKALKKYLPTPEENKEIQKQNGYMVYIKQNLNDVKSNKYKDFVKTTGYGTGEGLCGWNCRHTFSLFYPNINVNNQKKFTEKENEQYYQTTQNMRAMERGIRELRRRKRAMEAAGVSKDDPKYKRISSDLNNSHTQYNNYCRAHKMRPLEERLNIPNWRK